MSADMEDDFVKATEASIEANPALARAADKLSEIGNYHGWWGTQKVSWRDLDPIGKSEFFALVGEVIVAYKAGTKPNIDASLEKKPS